MSSSPVTDLEIDLSADLKRSDQIRELIVQKAEAAHAVCRLHTSAAHVGCIRRLHTPAQRDQIVHRAERGES